ncbi:MAG: exo-beta-N-acetylmuramidase NamZ domain-containing protein [Planctomycetota bacterium]
MKTLSMSRWTHALHALVLLLVLGSAPAAAQLSAIHAAVNPLVEESIGRGDIPGCVVTIGNSSGVYYQEAFGQRQIEPTPEPMTADTVFDLASLTKPVATATSVMRLVEQGSVRLRAPISAHLPEFGENGKGEITIEQLLTHQGGLIADNKLADYQDGPEKSWERICALGLKAEPGSRFIYTDVGFIVLGKLVEKVSGKPLNEFARDEVFAPLGMGETGFLPPQSLHARTAPTEFQDGAWLKGTVHDPRAALLGGVAGHAGLFSTAGDLGRYARAMLRTLHGQAAGPLSRAAAQEMIRPRDVAGNWRGLGWDSASRYSSNRGELLSSRAFGHGGFTGTAMWIDPELDLYVIVLSNRLHPDGKGSVNDLAGRIGSIAAANRAQRHRPPTPAMAEAAVQLGIDVLRRDGFKQLAGARVGLITNHTGLDSTGASAIDLLHAAESCELVCLFSPEHGIRGELDQSKISDGVDEKTGLPVYSLYGKTRKPLPEQLASIDTLVFDIQDIGTRFYTYISTMGLAMEAAAESGKKFIVLDRPNPIGGVAVAGPVLDAGSESFVAHHTIPIRHGMTVGELAMMFRGELGIDVKLQIVQTEGWRRGEYWDATGLTWVNPSPNMRSLTQAFLYPGVGILETTNVSVGRGTDTPFELIGAPWINQRELAAALNARRLPGVRFVPVRFTPDASKHAGLVCGGVNIVVTDRAAAEPIGVGLQLALELRRLYPDDWEVGSLNRLLGNQAVREEVLAGVPLEQITQGYQAGVDAFLVRRSGLLLYEE